MNENVFDITWANYWINKYKKNHKPKKIKLVQQIVDIQKELGEKSILGNSLLITGNYSYNELKSVIENDMNYHLDFPKDAEEHKRQHECGIKFFKNKQFNIKIS